MNRGASPWEAVSLGCHARRAMLDARGRALAINRWLYRPLVSVSQT